VTLVLLSFLIGFVVFGSYILAGHFIYDLWSKLKTERFLYAESQRTVTALHNQNQELFNSLLLLKQLLENFHKREAERGNGQLTLSNQQVDNLGMIIAAHLDSKKIN